MNTENCQKVSVVMRKQETASVSTLLLAPDSKALVAGTLDLAAPQAMLLKNEKLMVRRKAVRAVPCLLYSGCSSKHGNQLMWSPWERLEQVTGEQNEEETDDQKKVRQPIFSLSVFPTLEDEIEDDDV